MTASSLATKQEKCLSQFSQQIQDLLHDKIRAPYSFLPAAVVLELCEIINDDNKKLGQMLLPLAASFAEVPVSHFQVGAVAFDHLGNAYLGANFEFRNVHIGQTIHAEQSAIAHAWSRGAKHLALLVINYAPCGHCRQFINEVNLTDDFCIQLPDLLPLSLEKYLPKAFGPADLAVTERILNKVIPTSAENLSLLAHKACQNAHAPYSYSHSGIALQYDDDMIAGSYAENAAFNPSLPPLQMALNFRRLQGKDWHNIEQAVLVEKTGVLSQRQNTEQLLKSFCAIDLNYQPFF